MSKRLLGLLTRVGRATEIDKSGSQREFFRRFSLPVAQTLGRHQYYRAEQYVFMPDSIKWALRFPLRFAISEPSYKYKTECEEKILKFLSLQFKHDLSGGDQDLNLDMTLEEAEFLMMASDDIKAKAESGELLALTSWMRDFHDQKSVLLTTVYDELDRAIQQADALENEIVEDLADEAEDLLGLRQLEIRTSLMDDLAGVSSDQISFENLILVEGYVAKNPKADDVASKAETLRQLMTVRGAALQAKMEIQSILLGKETEDDLSRQDYLALVQNVHAYTSAGSAETQGEALTLMGQIQKTRDGDMQGLLDLLDEHTDKQAEMDETFANYCDFSDEKQISLQMDDNFRIELLKFMASNIYVKNHRYRYQKEQFDRFIATTHLIGRSYKKKPLRDLAMDYARLIDAMVDSSHNFKCPKIDANYDDFSQKTVMPVNATVFYYFFSTNRQGKTFAQWILSSVRYPNERMRRAYIRFFS